MKIGDVLCRISPIFLVICLLSGEQYAKLGNRGGVVALNLLYWLKTQIAGGVATTKVHEVGCGVVLDIAELSIARALAPLLAVVAKV